LKIDSFKNAGYKSGVYVGLVNEKNQRPKYHATVPLKKQIGKNTHTGRLENPSLKSLPALNCV
jgi:hypothetical protein